MQDHIVDVPRKQGYTSEVRVYAVCSQHHLCRKVVDCMVDEKHVLAAFAQVHQPAIKTMCLLVEVVNLPPVRMPETRVDASRKHQAGKYGSNVWPFLPSRVQEHGILHEGCVSIGPGNVIRSNVKYQKRGTWWYEVQ